VQQDSTRRVGLDKRVVHVALFVALAVVPVLALNSLATATPSSSLGGDATGGRARPALTDAQRQCLADQGITVPDRGDASEGIAITGEERHALRDAARACGLRGRGGPGLRALTDAQRQCLTDQGVTARPQSAEQRAALRSAAETCGLTKGGHRKGPNGTI
jgi:hypothetical protein